jgi:hypothetical protein
MTATDRSEADDAAVKAAARAAWLDDQPEANG